MSEKEVRTILEKQLQRLSDSSENRDYQFGGNELASITNAMVELCEEIRKLTD